MSKSLLTLLLACAPLSCGGPSVGEIVSQEVVMRLSTVGEGRRTAQVERLIVNASSVRLEACAENVEPLELGARSYDLAQERAPSETVRTAVKAHCGVRLEVEPLDGVEREGVPEGASLHVEGTDAEGEPFTVTSTEAFRLELRAVDEGGFGVVPLLLGVDVTALLADLPLDEESSEEASRLLPEKLVAASALYTDEDDDGELDDDESDPVALP